MPGQSIFIMFKGKSEKSSHFESWRETVLLIFSELCEIVYFGFNYRKKLFDRKKSSWWIKKIKEKKCCSTNRTNHVDVTWICWTQTQCCRNNCTKRDSFPGLCMGGFLFPFASSAFTSPILCLAECIVVLLVWRRAADLAESLQKPGLKAWEKAAVWLD